MKSSDQASELGIIITRINLRKGWLKELGGNLCNLVSIRRENDKGTLHVVTISPKRGMHTQRTERYTHRGSGIVSFAQEEAVRARVAFAHRCVCEWVSEWVKWRSERMSQQLISDMNYWVWAKERVSYGPPQTLSGSLGEEIMNGVLEL